MSIRANVDARRLDQRVRLQRLVDLASPQEDTGEPRQRWEDLVTAGDRMVAAAVDGRKATEPLVTDGLRTVSDFTFWLRADVIQRLALRPADRIVWRDMHFDIIDLPDQQLRSRLIPVTGRAGASDG